MAITLRPARPVTDEELLELSERNPGYQFERSAKGYERTVEVYRPGQEPQALTNPATIALDPELAGFALELAPIFEA